MVSTDGNYLLDGKDGGHDNPPIQMKKFVRSIPYMWLHPYLQVLMLHFNMKFIKHGLPFVRPFYGFED